MSDGIELSVVLPAHNEQDAIEGVIAEAAQAAMDSCKPIDDTRGSARYRKQMVRNLTRSAITDVWTKIR